MNTLDKLKSYVSSSQRRKIAKDNVLSSYYNSLQDGLGGVSFDAATQTPNFNTYFEFNDPNNKEYTRSLSLLRATSREQFRNNGLYKGVIVTTTDHVIGAGIKPKSVIDSKKLNGITEEQAGVIQDNIDNYFNSWAESTLCDITGKDNFYLLQRLYYENFKRDGDAFAIMPLTKVNSKKILQIQLIDATNVQSENSDFTQGIERSKNGLPLKYSILQNDNSFKVIKAFSTNNKRNMFHLFKREHAKQIRGLPFLTAVIRNIDYIDNYMKSELNAANLSSKFFGSITTATKEDLFGEGDDTTSNFLNNQTPKQTTRNTIRENSITQLQPGEKLEIHEKGRDNPNFDKFFDTNLNIVSSCSRIAGEIIISRFVSSYSASRAAMLQMNKLVRPERLLMNTSFNNPIRRQVITWGVLSGELNIPNFFDNIEAYLNCIWIGDPVGSVDPQKDVSSKVLAINNNLLTRTQATTDLGNSDFRNNVNILKKENKLLINDGLIPAEGSTSND